MERLKNIALGLLLLLFVASIGLNVYYISKPNECMGDTTRTIFVDTIPFYKPIPKDSVVIRYITKKLPISTDGVHKEDVDSANVVIPITQTMYEDSTYRAYISGYRAGLDSIFIFPRSEIVTISKYRGNKTNPWSIGVQMGYGMVLKGTARFTPYIGVGVSYNLFSF